MNNHFVSSILTLIFVSSMLVGCKESSEDLVFYVSADECDEHMLTKNVNITGVVESEDAGVYTVSTKLQSFRIKSLKVRSGDEVNEGDVICELDSDKIEKDIKAVEERLKNAQSIDEQNINELNAEISRNKKILDLKIKQIEEDISSDQKKYNEAEQNFNRTKSELESTERAYSDAVNNLANAVGDETGYYSELCENMLQKITVSRNEMESYSSVMTSIKTKLDDYNYQIEITKLEFEKKIADSQLEIDTYQSNDELKEQLRELKESLEECIIYAPCNGIVKDVYVTSGQVSSESSIVTIVRKDKKIIHASLNDNDVLLVDEGMKTEINFGQESVIGEVTRINRIKGEDGFDVYIDVSETNKLNIGMSVTNSIRIFEEEALSVNKNALIEDNGDYYVYVAVPQANDSYIAEYKPVTIGIQDDVNAEICSGISKGDIVVTSEMEYLEDGACVEIKTASDYK